MKYLYLFVCLLFTVTSFSQDNSTTKTEVTEASNEVPFQVIEKVPIYSGCDENMGNQALKECMGSQIATLVNKHFNTKLAQSLKLSPGKHRISVQFKVDKEGNVVGVRAKAPHPTLEKEAIRVTKLIPQLDKPGYQKGKPVIVPYGFPISFIVDDGPKASTTSSPEEKTNKIDSYPIYRSCSENLDYQGTKICTKEKIIDFIKLGFNYELADKLFPLDKSTQFLVEFTIDEKGKTKNITAKAHKKEIAAEAIKLVKRLPKMKKPGYLNGEPVPVPFRILMTIYF
ncbi:MAG: hypothetical protein KBT69_14720 [Oceanihabitans sp.]|nr:hypothetical protein [Oceanihabitans sp.]